MKKLKFIPLVMFSVMLLASCQSKESKIEKLVTSHLEQSLENPQNLKVLEIAQPDSAFGLNYFTKQEQAYMMNTITDVTKVLMEAYVIWTLFWNAWCLQERSLVRMEGSCDLYLQEQIWLHV